RLVERGAGTG
ncbi:hypothetical protein QE152_g41391, partial [Popillia japonica]